MTDKNRYPKVVSALKKLDHDELAELGRKGAASSKKKKIPYKIRRMLMGAEEAARQANLHIAPIED